MTAWPARLGWPGLAALLALAAAVLLAAWVTPLLQVQSQQQAPAMPEAPPLRVAPTPAAAITLPAASDPADRVADLLALALRHGVSVVRTQQQREQQGPVQRLQLLLSAQGRYTELRSFIAAALQADPGLALDTLQLRRATPEQPLFDAELQWSLLRAPDHASDDAGASAGRARAPWPAPGTHTLLAWSAPAAPAAAPTPPALAQKPPTPPFPYRWIGRLDDGSTPQVLLAGAQRSFGARAGDVLDGRWRIDAIAGAQLQLTWLPSGEAITVDTR